MRFSVPQFIDVEDKIFGPLTLKQAIYLAGGIGIGFVFFTRFGFFFAVLFGLPIAILSFALAFMKVNNRPFVFMVYAAVFYAIKNKLYLWKKTEQAPLDVGGNVQNTMRQQVVSPKLTQSRLKELAWSLDTNDTLYSDKDQWK
jgi:hypothetical protein